MRAKEIYFGLSKSWESECSDEPWLESLKRQYSISANEWTADRFFLITISWGPWKPERQIDVWESMKKRYSEVVDDLCNAKKIFKGFPLQWQNNRVKNISKYLNQKSITFKDSIMGLRSLNGLVARDHLAELAGAKQNKKTISCFIRDFLLKDTFPIDSRVSEMLSSLGLHNDEDLMIKLCELDGISSRLLNRMLYTHWEYCPSRPSKKCEECRINNYCWDYLLSKKE